MKKGRFITLEGGEGAGKSTQATLLAQRLRAEAGLDVVETREPGGAPAAEEIRRLLVEGHAEKWSPLSEALMMYAARREHLDRLIAPALADGRWVVCDRFSDSTMAYQGYAGGLGRYFIEKLDDMVVGPAFEPDLTLVIDLPVSVGLGRASARGGHENRFELKGAAFHERLREAYLDIARRAPHRCVIIDGEGRPDEIADALWAAAHERLML